MKKSVKTAVVVAAALLAAVCVLIGCGGKSDGGKKGDHTCTKVCPVCGYCLDFDCYEDACWDKCGDNLLYDAGYEAIDLKVAKTGVTVTADLGCAKDFNKANNSSIAFKVEASEAETVTLAVTVGKTSEADVYTDVTTVKINDGEPLVRPSVVPVYDDAADSDRFYELCLGCVEVQKGVNTFTFIAEGDGEHSHDFKKLTIIGNARYTLLQGTQIEHQCSSVCAVCGGCRDFTCYNPGCAGKCVCDGGAPATLYWVCDERVTTSRPVNKELDGIGCTWNQETRIKYVIEASKAGEVTFGAVVSRDSGEVKFTDQFKVTANGALLEGDGVIPVSSSGKREWNEYGLVVVGKISLAEGRNEVIISQTPIQKDGGGTGMAYNFQSMVIFGDGTYGWHVDDPAQIADAHLCEVCGGCPEQDCEYHDSDCTCIPHEIKWTEATISGGNKANAKEDCVGVAAYNKRAYIEYDIKASAAGKARVYFTISCLPSAPPLNMIFDTVKVNGIKLTTEATVPKGTKWTEYGTVFVAAAEFVAGSNRVEIEYTVANADVSVNFRSISVAHPTNTYGAFTHDMTEHPAVEPTCTESGNIAYYTCSCCNKVWADADGATEITLADATVAATGHSYAQTLVVTGAKTQYEPGEAFDTSGLSVVLDCENCTDGDITLTEGMYTVSKTEPLDVSDASIVISYTDGENTYSYTVSITVAHVHDLGEIVAAKQPTCTESGNVAYYECNTCHKHFADGDAQNEIADITVDALGHTLGDTVAAKSPTCAATGNVAYRECSVCHKYLTQDGESEIADPTVAVDPDAHHVVLAPDRMKKVCTLCGNVCSYEFNLSRAETNRDPKATDGLGSTWNQETRATFGITASKAGSATLYAYLSRDVKEVLFTDAYKTYINGSDTPYVGTGKMPAYAKTAWTTYDRIEVGIIELVEGANTVTFSFLPTKASDGGLGVAYNFLKIELKSADGAVYGWTDGCDRCEVCGGCTETDCTENCETVCACGQKYILDHMDDRVSVEGTRKNTAEWCIGATNGTVYTVKYYVYSDKDTTAKLYVNSSAISTKWEIRFDATWTTTVNGATQTTDTIHHNGNSGSAIRGATSRWDDFVFEYVSEVQLKAGVNEIVFTATGAEVCNMREIAFTQTDGAVISLASPSDIDGDTTTE